MLSSAAALKQERAYKGKKDSTPYMQNDYMNTLLVKLAGCQEVERRGCKGIQSCRQNEIHRDPFEKKHFTAL